MLGFLKKLIGGGAAGPDRDGVVTFRPEDLESYARLGPKLAAIAKTYPDITMSVYDPSKEVVLFGYRGGDSGTVVLNVALRFLQQAQTGAEVQTYLDGLFRKRHPSGEGLILPILKSAGYVESSIRQAQELGGLTDGAAPFWYTEVAPGLVLILVRDSQGRMTFLSEEGMTLQGLTLDAAHDQAAANLSRLMDEAPLREAAFDGAGLKVLRLDGTYESSSFFMTGMWDSFAQDYGAPPAVIFGARNLVVYGNSAEAEAMAALYALASADNQEPEFAIAPHQIWLWQDGRWQPHQKPADVSAGPQ